MLGWGEPSRIEVEEHNRFFEKLEFQISMSLLSLHRGLYFKRDFSALPWRKKRTKKFEGILSERFTTLKSPTATFMED